RRHPPRRLSERRALRSVSDGCNRSRVTLHSALPAVEMPPPIRHRPCLQIDCRSAAYAAYLTELAQHEATMGKDGPDRSRCRMDDRHVWMEEGPRQRSRPPPADGGLAAQERKEHRETTWPAD